MRRQRLTRFAATIGMLALFLCTTAMSQDKNDAKDKPAAGGMDPAAMQSMMDAGKPGEMQKMLEPMAGKFTYVNKFRMDPAQEWTTTNGEYEGQMIMDGRYLTYSVHGPMMGSEFQGMGCMAYDNMLKKHVAAWIDNMGTGIMRSEGTCSPDHKTITFTGEMLDPMTQKMTPYKYVYEIKGDDSFTMRWWSPSMSDGKMFESMNIEFTRVK